MNILRIPMFVLAMAVSAHGFAATAQQEKMTACNAEATTKAPWPSRPMVSLPPRSRRR
ncbi:PsiF family protein [Pseudomonas aeruginosa]